MEWVWSFYLDQSLSIWDCQKVAWAPCTLGSSRGLCSFKTGHQDTWNPLWWDRELLGSWENWMTPLMGAAWSPPSLDMSPRGYRQHFWNGSVTYCFLHTHTKRLRMNSHRRHNHTVLLCSQPHTPMGWAHGLLVLPAGYRWYTLLLGAFS